ncbi:MAG TPA: polysaccharide deacetylase family protein [Pricia sp.]|nr:polysaccharide deacetylase family protein [Pricia sp.]
MRKTNPKPIHTPQKKWFGRRSVNLLTISVMLGLLILARFVTVPWWIFILMPVVWFAITACGSFFIGWDYHLTSMHANTNCTANWISLSFDDGPNPEFTPRILQLLAQHGAKATFFCIGQQANDHPDILKQILAERHSIGNHTYTHSPSFGFFSSQRVIYELRKTKSLIKDLTGLEMNLYRPAFGVTNPQIEKAVKTLDLHSIGWSVRSLDTTARSEMRVLNRITSKISRGDIVLLHDTGEKTIRVLERLLVFLQEENLQSVPVERLLEIEAYA